MPIRTGKKNTREAHKRYIHPVLKVQREAIEQYDRWQVANGLLDTLPATATEVLAAMRPASEAAIATRLM